jgi:hypothetical protein
VSEPAIFQEGHVTCNLRMHPIEQDISVGPSTYGVQMKRWWTLANDYIIFDFHGGKGAIYVSDFKEALENLMIKTRADLGDAK